MILFLCNVKGPVNSQFLKIERYLLEFFGKQLTFLWMERGIFLTLDKKSIITEGDITIVETGAQRVTIWKGVNSLKVVAFKQFKFFVRLKQNEPNF